MASMLPLLALACTSSGPDGPTSLHPTLTVDAEAGTFATVTWTTEEVADGRLEFGDDTAYGASLEATESEGVALGFTHAEAGGALLHRWGFPPAMAEPVRWQYTPQSAGNQSRMADLLFLAKWLRAK